VFIPAHLANADVVYVVDTSDGPVKVPIDQAALPSSWVSLGTYQFFGSPKVHLDTITPLGNGLETVAFDAAAIEPLHDGPAGATYTPMIENYGGGNCLMVQGNSTVPGAKAEERGCTSWGYEYWNAVDLGGTMPSPDDPTRQLAKYSIKNRPSGLCLEIMGGRTDDGAPIQLGTCVAGDTNQQWTAPPPPPQRPEGPGNQMIVNVKSGNCLSLGAQNSNGTSPIVARKCNLNENYEYRQYWRGLTEYNGLT
jgi:hypothetical protein